MNPGWQNLGMAHCRQEMADLSPVSTARATATAAPACLGDGSVRIRAYRANRD